MNNDIKACHLTVDRVDHALPPLLSYVDRLYKRDTIAAAPKPHIVNMEETMKTLVNTEKSLIRMGDGELILAAGGRNIVFQHADERLKERLIEILESDDEHIMIALSTWFWYKILPIKRGWDWSLSEYPAARVVADEHLVPGKTYYDAEISLIYGLTGKNTQAWYEQWRRIWQDKEIAVICGDRVFDKLIYNVFDNAAHIEYLYVPTRNAFDEYDDILDAASKININKIICIMAGPTAKVLAFDLCRHYGFRCLDVGHLAKDYDCWKRQLTGDDIAMQEYWSAD